MKNCVLNLEELGIVNREFFVLYASDSHVVYKQDNQIVLANCTGDIIQSQPAPVITKSYELAYNDNLIIFLFENKTLLSMSLDGVQYHHHDITQRNLGKVITKIHLLGDKMLFGTAHYGSFQFVIYDYLAEKRISQSCSYPSSVISKIFLGKKHFYIIQDQSLLHCFDVNTCETLWRRFEVGNISGDVLEKGGLVYYGHGNKIKVLSAPDEVETLGIPLKKIHTLMKISKSHLYFAHNDNKNIACFDLDKKIIKWDMSGYEKIDQFLFIKGRNKNDEHDVVVVRIKDNVGIIDITDGKLLYFFKVASLYNIEQTSNCVLLHKYSGQTDILPGY